MGQKQTSQAPPLSQFPDFLEAIENNDIFKAKEIYANTEVFKLHPDILRDNLTIFCLGDKLFFNQNKHENSLYFTCGSLLRYGISAGVSLEMFKFLVDIVDSKKAWRNMSDERFGCEYILDYALCFQHYFFLFPDERSKNSREIFFYILHNYQTDERWMREYLFKKLLENKFRILSKLENYLSEQTKTLYLCCLAKKGVCLDFYERLFPDSPDRRSELIDEQIKDFFIDQENL